MDIDDLFDALKQKNVEKAEKILPLIDINTKNKNGLTPLHIACQFNVEPIINILLDNPHLNLERYFLLSPNDSPIHLATTNKNKEVVQKLLEKKPKFINLANRYGDTILHIAVNLNDIEMVQLLLTSKLLEIDKKKDTLYTPFHLAVLNKNFEIANLLLKNAANIHEPLQHNSTLLLKAINHMGIEEDIINYLFQFPIDVNHQNKNQTTALHVACAYNHANLAIRLIDLGASLEIKDDNGKTPFDLTKKTQNVE